MRDIILYGAGGHCKVVMDILDAMGIRVSKVLDDNPKSNYFMGIPCSSPSNCLESVIITIGHCNIRKKITAEICVNEYITAVHPFSFVSKNSTLGEGTVVMQGAVIQSGTAIGKHCIVNTNSSVDHDCKVNDFVHVASGATICGNVEVGECSWVGAGSVVVQGIKIGKNCMIGAGSVIIRDIPDNAIVVGNPGRIIKYNNYTTDNQRTSPPSIA